MSRCPLLPGAHPLLVDATRRTWVVDPDNARLHGDFERSVPIYGPILRLPWRGGFDHDGRSYSPRSIPPIYEVTEDEYEVDHGLILDILGDRVLAAFMDDLDVSAVGIFRVQFR